MLGSTAIAQFSAQVSSAETVFQGKSQAIGYLGLHEDVVCLVGGLCYGIGGYTDATVKLGLMDYDSTVGDNDGFMLSGEVKYQLMETRIKDPIDMSLGCLFETILGIGNSNFLMGGFITGSHSIQLKNNKEICPFGRLLLGWERYGSNNNSEISFNAGANYKLNESTSVSGEFHFDDQFGFIVSLIYGL